MIEAAGVEGISHLSDDVQVHYNPGNQSAIGDDRRLKDIPVATICSRMYTATTGALKTAQINNATVGTLNSSGDVVSADLYGKSAVVVQRQEDRATTDRDDGQNFKAVGVEKSLFVPGVSESHGDQSAIVVSNLEVPFH